jgi:hypothetical protein
MCTLCSEKTLKLSSPALANEAQLVYGQWNFLECKLLWKKGLHDVAQATLRSQVIAALSSYQNRSDTEDTQQIQSTRNRRNSSTAKFGVNAHGKECCDLLSDALHTMAEWMIQNRTASPSVILNDYLLPAADLGNNLTIKLKIYETLGKRSDHIS